MGIDHAHQRFCDNCGRTIDKAVRVHRGADYCRSCYQRTFVQKPCSVCAATTRVHRHDEEPPVCPACIRATRLCARCERACPRAGKLLGSTKEAVCPACVPRVSEPQPCPRCNEPSTRLSRPFTGLLDPMCDRCRNSLTHGTCVTCRRYRKVAGHLPNDMPYCASCVPGQAITHSCPGCGQEVPGNGAGRCQNCGTRDLVRKDAAEHALTLAPWVGSWWQDFVESQLIGERLSPQLRARMNRAADFFRMLGERFSSIDAMDTQSVLRMGSSILRQHLLASRFVFARLEELGESTKKDAVQARVAMVEQERLQSVLDDAESAPYAAALLAYTQALSWQSVAVRTIRMYVRAAERFCAQVPFDGVSPWSADDLLRYLSACPGQGASLARFVSYCRAAYGWDVAMPPGTLWKSKKTKAQKDFDAFKRVWRHTAQEGRCAMSTKVLAISFGRSFGVSAAHMLRQREEHGAPRTADGSIMVLPDAVIGVRHPMYPLALRWADLAERLADRRRRRTQRP